MPSSYTHDPRPSRWAATIITPSARPTIMPRTAGSPGHCRTILPRPSSATTRPAAAGAAAGPRAGSLRTRRQPRQPLVAAAGSRHHSARFGYEHGPRQEDELRRHGRRHGRPARLRALRRRPRGPVPGDQVRAVRPGSASRRTCPWASRRRSRRGAPSRRTAPSRPGSASSARSTPRRRSTATTSPPTARLAPGARASRTPRSGTSRTARTAAGSRATATRPRRSRDGSAGSKEHREMGEARRYMERPPAARGASDGRALLRGCRTCRPGAESLGRTSPWARGAPIARW